MRSRKFILALMTLLSVTLLCVFKYVDDDTYAHVVIATVGAYLAANVLQKVKTKPTGE